MTASASSLSKTRSGSSTPTSNNDNNSKVYSSKKVKSFMSLSDAKLPIVSFKASNNGPKCPFKNKSIEFNIYEGGCVWLRGNSGVGKTTLSMYLALQTGTMSNKCNSTTTTTISDHNNHDTNKLKHLDITIERCEWESSIVMEERCGVLFQQSTLIDELTIAGNICLALQSCPSRKIEEEEKSRDNNNPSMIQDKIIEIMEMVGLNYYRDANKRVMELSGGMARRASLALQLAQRKRIIILDEPFAGLDYSTALSIIQELKHLRKQRGTAFLLISHEPHLAKLVMEEEEVEEDENEKGNANKEAQDDTDKQQKPKKEDRKEQHVDENNTIKDKNENEVTKQDQQTTREFTTVTLYPSVAEDKEGQIDDTNNGNKTAKHKISNKQLFYGITFYDRFMDRLYDYILYSLPLIVLTFIACGLAISMLSSDILQRIEVTDKVLEVLDKELGPLIKLVTGQENNPLYMMMAKGKVKSMLNIAVPEAKAKLYSIGIAKLFILEIGPLITSLLLCGRIGGSYSGKIATMIATDQNQLLLTLGISTTTFTFLPSFFASIIASPILSSIGTIIAIYIGSLIGPLYGIGTYETYMDEAYDTIFPELRLPNNFLYIFCYESINLFKKFFLSLFGTNDSKSSSDSGEIVDYIAIEIITYPIIYHLLKAITYISITMVSAELIAALNPNLSSRNVPSVITSTVVISSLLIIISDWGFSQLLILRE